MNRDLLILAVINGSVILSCVYFGLFVYPKLTLSEETQRRSRTFISNAFFREFWYFLMEPLKKWLIRRDVHPNTITLLGLGFSILAAVGFALGEFGLGGWMVILSGTCDVYDGQLARARNLTLKSGAFFDSLLDRISEAAIFGGFLWWYRNDPIFFNLSLVTAMASQIISYSRARAEGLGFTQGSDKGLFQRAERLIILSIGATLSPLFGVFFQDSELLVRFTIFILALGSFQTAWSRSLQLYKMIQKADFQK